MRIFVCIKQVPDTETKIKINPEKTGIDTNGVKWILNPYDEFAVEEAIKLKEANSGAQLTAVSLGPKKRVTDVIRTALAMGADDGIIIDAPENSNINLTAKALAETIRKEGEFNYIFTGKLAIDDNAASVSQMLAQNLEISHATVVSKFETNTDGALVERDSEGGAKEVIQMNSPCLVAANKGLNMPRYASLPGIMKAKKKPLKEIALSELNLTETESKTQFVNYQLPPDKPAIKMISGDPNQQAAELVKLLREEAKVI